MSGLSIADRWFERKRLDGGVTWLWEPHVHPLLRCNIWHVAGRDRDLLVDTGLGVASLVDEMRDLLDKPVVAVATHVHYDHVGNLHEFETRVMHRSEAAQMFPYREFSELVTAHFPREFLEELTAAGDPVEGEFLLDAIPEPGFDPAAFAISPAEITREVDEGDAVDLGDRRFEVMHLPGHSPGSIGLWEERSRTLFSGDAIYDGPLLDNLPESDIDAYTRTMKRLRVVPADVVHGGHEPSFGRERLIELADAYLAKRGV